jgi:hypothetical protein
MKTYGEWRYSSTILTSILDERVWSASLPGRFTHGTHWRGSWVDPRAGLDAVEERKTLFLRESSPGRPAHSPSLYPLSYPDS